MGLSFSEVRVCFRKESRTETMMLVSKLSRRQMKKTNWFSTERLGWVGVQTLRSEDLNHDGCASQENQPSVEVGWRLNRSL